MRRVFKRILMLDPLSRVDVAERWSRVYLYLREANQSVKR